MELTKLTFDGTMMLITLQNTTDSHLPCSTPEYIDQSFKLARKEGFSLGVKLVRGAYHPHELSAHESGITISPDALPPVHLTKTDTDSCYNACARVLVSQVRLDVDESATRSGREGKGGGQRIGVLFGTHNWESCNFILEELARQGLASLETEQQRTVFAISDQVNERITFGQLYGRSTCDLLSNWHYLS